MELVQGHMKMVSKICHQTVRLRYINSFFEIFEQDNNQTKKSPWRRQLKNAERIFKYIYC